MKNNFDSLLSYIEQTMKLDVPDFSDEIQKSRGIQKFIKKIVFKLTNWTIAPIRSALINHYESNSRIIMGLYQHTVHAFTEQEKVLRQLQKIINHMQNDYNQWIVMKEPTEIDLRYERIHRFKQQPTICLILPVTDVNSVLLGELLKSLRAQTYRQWRLYLIADSEAVSDELRMLCDSDERIELHDFELSGDCRGLVEFASLHTQGDFVGLLNQSELLAPFALFEIVAAINEFPDADFIYADDDKIKDDKRYDPNFKPDFAPDTLRSKNYIGNFFILKKDIMSQLPDRLEYSGDLFYEIVLHASELSKRIHHIPKILIHKRCPENYDSTEQTTKTGINTGIIKSHMTRHLGLTGNVSHIGVDDIYRVDYEVIGRPKVSILIPNKDHIELLKRCIDSILDLTTYDNYEIVVIENNSTLKETFDYYESFDKSEKVSVIYYPDSGFNYQKIINFAAKSCEADYILQLNNDTQLLTPDWLELMLGFAQRNDVGAVGAMLHYPDMSVQHAGGVFSCQNRTFVHIFSNMPSYAQGYTNRELLIQNMSWVTAACILCRKDTYEDIGYMTEDYVAAFGDVDFCFKIKASGKSIVFHPFVRLLHFECGTRGYDDTLEQAADFRKERDLLFSKWHKELEQGDPYYNLLMEKVLFENTEAYQAEVPIEKMSDG